MKGDHLPPGDHIARHCKPSSVETSGRINGTAFELRVRDGKEEQYLSVNWLEFCQLQNRKEQMEKIRNIYVSDKKFKLRAGARFAVLNVENVINKVEQDSIDNRTLSILHLPNPKEDLSHSGIYGYMASDKLIADLIADIVEDKDILPAKSP